MKYSEQGMKLVEGQNWVDNLTSTVRFSQAVSRALSEESSVLDLALDVGPHPALKGPTSEGAVEAFADSLGLIWTSFLSSRPLRIGTGARFEEVLLCLIVVSKVRNACTTYMNDKPSTKPSILKGLPTYPWYHDNLVWRESRASHLFRNSQPPHELLGRPTALGEDGRREIHWRQVFKLSELPWVNGHTIQGQVPFPRQDTWTMAYESAVRLVDDQQALRLDRATRC
ncbi:hypothetical protein BDW68DRAFT_178641 [Aspergillus falconensis]